MPALVRSVLKAELLSIVDQALKASEGQSKERKKRVERSRDGQSFVECVVRGLRRI